MGSSHDRLIDSTVAQLRRVSAFCMAQLDPTEKAFSVYVFQAPLFNSQHSFFLFTMVVVDQISISFGISGCLLYTVNLEIVKKCSSFLKNAFRLHTIVGLDDSQYYS